MKATIIRPDGTRIEAEGTPEEVAKLAPVPVPWPAYNLPICTCMGGLLNGSWCPVHGYPRIYPVIYGVGQNNAAAANPGTVFLGNVNVGGVLS